MKRTLSEHQVRLLRLHAQRLAGDQTGATNVAGVVRHMCGIPAQDPRAAPLAIRARTTGLHAGAVERACREERSVVRTWAMRGTLHLLAAEDVGWLGALLGPIFLAAGARRRHE